MGIAQVSYYFINLHSGRRIIWNRWTVLPMPAEVIASIHQLPTACEKCKGIAFTDRYGNIMHDTEDQDGKILEMTGAD